ncbi:ATP-dependent nuclease [Microbacterium maritypicum]|uniref:ATP-dependent nuclease n=1 Tax=Microbacterium maritypicum TaxID=33918 RepID=UPI003A924D31
MRIAKVEIENFRSIESLICTFDSVTTLVGPNGVGKSTILRALDWFFNGERGSLGERDVHQGAAPGSRVRVRVDFEGLSPEDRDALGERYAASPAVDTLSVWKTWHGGEEKITAKALAYPAFEEIRALASAGDKRSAYSALRTREAELGLPGWTSAAAAESAMSAWEAQNSSRLVESEVSDTHFFGINSRGKLSDLFDYVFVSADLRASDETSAARSSILSRILQRAVDRTALDEATTELVQQYTTALGDLSEEHLGKQLRNLEEELTKAVASFTLGRTVRLQEASPSFKPTPSGIDLHVSDAFVETSIELQGHGFQRTLLMSALTVLSARNRATTGGQMFLAIEEPELFQHPTQARAFASVLRKLAETSANATQVAYATHSSHFIEPRYFDQIRRVSATTVHGQRCMATRIAAANLEAVEARLSGYVPSDSLRRRLEQVCLTRLPAALFAESVILVEGEEDAAVLEGIAGEVNELAVAGICVAPVAGKSNMMIPYAILELLGVPTLMVVDNDSGTGSRMRRSGKAEDLISAAEAKTIKDNHAFCSFVGAERSDYPVGAVHRSLAFVPDTMETLLASDLPGWDLTRRRLIEEGRGVEGKNAATYEIAARECTDEPGDSLSALISLISRAA